MSESDNNPEIPVNDSTIGQGNPAWGEFLNVIPEEHHAAVQPVLQKWDQGVQQRFESYKPYEKYAKDKVDPQVIEYGLNLINQLNDNDGALEVFQTLGNYLETQGLLGQEEDDSGEEEEFDFDSLPKALRNQIEQLQGGFSTLAEAELAREQERVNSQEDALLEKELSDLRGKYGEFDDEFVLAKMINGADAEDAVKAYHTWVDKALQNRNRPTAPRVIGSAGDFPGNAPSFDPKKANARETRDFVTQMLLDHQQNR